MVPTAFLRGALTKHVTFEIKIPHAQKPIFLKPSDDFLGKNAVCPISCEGLFLKVSKRWLFGQSRDTAIPLNHNILYFSIVTGHS